MTAFTGKRIVETYDGRVEASPGDVFPLLCPKREYDWLEGWACDMIYSESGVAENNVIFTSQFGAGIEGTWVAVRREDVDFEFQFIIFFTGLAVARVDIRLTENGDGSTNLNWTRTLTSLSENGNVMVEHASGQAFTERTAWMVASLNHYLKTGEMLKKG